MIIVPGAYMLTMTKSACTPELSRITAMTANGKAVPRVELLPPGIVVVEALGRWVRRYPCLTLMHSVIMPDHIHLLVFVKEKSELTLGEMAGKFKGECSRLWWSHDATCLNKPFFAKGFNDKIVYRKGQKDNFYNYISDNPRRYLARKTYPEFFSKPLRLTVGKDSYSVYGNIFLLDHPVKTAVCVSSRYTPAELERHRRLWQETIRSGGVLISPFISNSEREIRDMGIAGGASLIVIVDNGFPPRFKPSGRYFELCSRGRLLLVAPESYISRKPVMTRRVAMACNELARNLAAGVPDRKIGER